MKTPDNLNTWTTTLGARFREKKLKMIGSLEQEMRDIMKSLGEDFEKQLLTEISLLLIKETRVKP